MDMGNLSYVKALVESGEVPISEIRSSRSDLDSYIRSYKTVYFYWSEEFLKLIEISQYYEEFFGKKDSE